MREQRHDARRRWFVAVSAELAQTRPSRLKTGSAPGILVEISDATFINWRDCGRTGLAVGTLRRWHRQGLLMPFGRTVGGHRRYQRDTVRAILDAEPAIAGKTGCCACVFLRDQAGQLKTQAARPSAIASTQVSPISRSLQTWQWPELT